MTKDDPPRPASFPPGYDEEDPYEDIDLSMYPAWWRRNVAEFRAHEMRPYRPPRFADGTVTTDVINRLEERLDVSVQIRAVDPQDGGDWRIVVEGDPAGSVEHVRTQAGHSRYEITAEAFEAVVTEAVED